MKKIGFISVLLFAVSTTNAGETLKYGGSGTIGRGFIKASEILFESKSPSIDLQIIGDATGSTTAIKEIIAENYDIGGVSRDLKEEELKQGIFPTLVGFDPIVTFVNAKRNIQDISLKELADIFSGRITNWKEIGDTNHSIKVIVHPKEAATNDVFQEVVLGKEPFGENIIYSNIGDQEEQYKVAQDPWAISFASPSMAKSSDIRILSIHEIFADPKTIAEKKYPLFRPLYLVTKGKPKEAAKKYIDFILSAKGQSIVSKEFYHIKNQQ